MQRVKRMQRGSEELASLGDAEQSAMSPFAPSNHLQFQRSVMLTHVSIAARNASQPPL